MLMVVKITRIVCLPGLASILAALASDEIEKPNLSKDGQIICGTKSIRQALTKPPYHALTLCLDIDDLCTGGESIDCGAGGSARCLG